MYGTLGRMRGRGLWLCGVLACLGLRLGAAAPELRPGDMVVFVGGGTLVAMEQQATVETLLTLALRPGVVRFRTLAWEGDTVFARPRELNFPVLTNQLAALGATMVFAQWGASESLAGESGLARFRAAVAERIAEIRTVVPRLVLVTPPPFEAKPAPLPDLARWNPTLAAYVAVLRDAAAAAELPVVDLFEALSRRPPSSPFTHDGREWTPAGHEAMAAVWARETGHADWAELAEAPGFWRRPEVVRVQDAVRTKNRLWFDSWRPMNWAFLNGDRTEQLSSRDHRDPKIRWFPSEMERFGPLIVEAEARVASESAQVELGGRR